MWLAALVIIAIADGVASSYGSRFQATSLWAGKALAPPESADSAPRGVQDALLQGFESWLGIALPAIALATGVLAFRYAWWGSVVIYVAYGVAWVFADRKLMPKTVDWYLLRLHNTLANRAANYAKAGDALRADAALSIDSSLTDLYAIYMGTGVAAPTMKFARAVRNGDESSLLYESGASSLTRASAPTR